MLLKVSKEEPPPATQKIPEKPPDSISEPVESLEKTPVKLPEVVPPSEQQKAAKETPAVKEPAVPKLPPVSKKPPARKASVTKEPKTSLKKEPKTPVTKQPPAPKSEKPESPPKAAPVQQSPELEVPKVDWCPFQYQIRRLISRSLKSQACMILNAPVALKFEKHLSSIAADMPVKFHSDWKDLHTNLIPSRLCKILR